MKTPKIEWIPFDRNNPPQDLCPDETFLIFFREDNYNNGVSWSYLVDTATPCGSYLDNFWETENDWDEGQKIEVLAYARFPIYQKETELEEKTNVIRCKDCKYRTWFALGYGCGNFKSPFYQTSDEDVAIMTKPNDFCSYAEKEEQP